MPQILRCFIAFLQCFSALLRVLVHHSFLKWNLQVKLFIHNRPDKLMWSKEAGKYTTARKTTAYIRKRENGHFTQSFQVQVQYTMRKLFCKLKGEESVLMQSI